MRVILSKQNATFQGKEKSHKNFIPIGLAVDLLHEFPKFIYSASEICPTGKITFSSILLTLLRSKYWDIPEFIIRTTQGLNKYGFFPPRDLQQALTVIKNNPGSKMAIQYISAIRASLGNRFNLICLGTRKILSKNLDNESKIILNQIFD